MLKRDILAFCEDKMLKQGDFAGGSSSSKKR